MEEVMSIILQLSKEFEKSQNTIEEILKLFDEGNTVPFIARYRKEVTGSMEDQDLRQLLERYEQLQALQDRRDTIVNTLEEQGNLTDELRIAIAKAQTMAELEDIYRPYKPKKRTRATVAREAGYGPLAELFLDDSSTMEEVEALIESTIDEEHSEEDIRQGLNDIVAEVYQDNARLRKILKKYLRRNAELETTKGKEEDRTYEMYFDRKERLSRIPNHRVLAIDRGEKEEALRVKLISNEEELLSIMLQTIKPSDDKKDYAYEIAKDSLKRLIYPSLERELRGERSEEAQREAIDVFGKNLRPLLLTPPLRDKRVLAIDPGNRTGCKVAVIDEYGVYLDDTVIYPTPPREDIEGSTKTMMELIDKYNLDVIAIGSGTASHETEIVVSNMIQDNDLDVEYAIVNEDGASVYSASEVAINEFPELDVTVRGAISIGRRLQDPLAELVKIEPRHIGVGQYQHDLDPKELDARLDGVVEDCVNHVGVNVNTASASLLSHVAGINKGVANNIVEYRMEEGPFLTREEIQKVKGLGPKTYEQAAGFLRIPDGEEPLDNTAVHPESYKVARVLQDESLEEEERQALIEEMGVGEYTLEDIIKELKQPGRDPREDLEATRLRTKALTMEDLEEGLILKGTVRNVVDFGAFVDIGVEKSGLLHISQMKDRGRKRPYDLVEVGDIIEVEVIEVDRERNRIGLKQRR